MAYSLQPDRMGSHLQDSALATVAPAAAASASAVQVLPRARGIVTAANVVDHVTPHRGDWNAFVTGELQSLCEPCHKSAIDRSSSTATAPTSGSTACRPIPITRSIERARALINRPHRVRFRGSLSARRRGDSTMARTYRDIAIEQMLETVEDAMSQVIDWWADLPPPMKEAIEQFRTQLEAAIDSVEFVKRALDRESTRR